MGTEATTGPDAVKALIGLCDGIAIEAFKIEGEARAGRGMSAAEAAAFAAGVRQLSQNTATMLRMMMNLYEAQHDGRA